MHMIGNTQWPLVIDIRGSKLVLTQARMVTADLEQRGLVMRIETLVTEGNTNRTSLSSLGGVEVFTVALHTALLEGHCDLVMHSLKDLPTVEVPGLMIAVVSTRADPTDVLVVHDGLHLADLPTATRIGTGSPRHARQLTTAHPDLSLAGIRGSAPTRIGRVRGLGTRAEQIGLNQNRAKEDLDAVVLAHTGLRHLGVEGVATDGLSETILPAGGQGALALGIVADGLAAEEGRILVQTLRIVDDKPTRLEVSTERALLRYLETGCAAPLGVCGQLIWENNTIELLAGVLEPHARVVGDNGESAEVSGETTVLLGTDADQRDFALAAAEQLGVDLAVELLANSIGEMAGLQTTKESGMTQSQGSRVVIHSRYAGRFMG